MTRSKILVLLLIGSFTCLTAVLNVTARRTLSLPLRNTGTQTNRPGYMPDSNLTPGDKLDVTRNDICAPGYAARIHDIPTSYKTKVFAAYGLTPQTAYEIDRLISIDLGGANSFKNLWPQPKEGEWNSQIKNQLEAELRRRVRNGSLDLKTAQQEIAKDWVAAFTKYLGKGKPRVIRKAGRNGHE